MSFSSGGSGGSSSIAGLTDVILNTPATNQVLTYDNTEKKWKNLAVPGGASPFTNVMTYGAAGDGSTDDSSAILAAVNAANGTPVYLPTGRFVVNLDFTDQDIHLTGPGVLVQANGAQKIMKVERTLGPAISVTQGTVQFGPNQPNASTYTQTYTTLSLTGGANYADFKAGDVYHLSSQDKYSWSDFVGAGGNIWQAEFVPILGIGMNITSLLTTSSFEGSTVTGVTSGATAVVDSTTVIDANNGKVLLGSCSKNFTVGESLKISGTTIGTAGSMYLTVAGKSPATYTTSPQIRKVDTSKKCILDVTLDANGDVNSFVGSSNRSAALTLAGVYRPMVKIAVHKTWSRALILESCYMGDIDSVVDGLPDHAQNAEGAYGYGVEIRGCSQGMRIKILGRNLRHAFTTNPNGATYGLRPLQYGISRYITVHDSVALSCFAAGFDTHEGAEFTLFDNCRVSSPASGNRVLTNGIGFNNRAFGTTYRNCLAEGTITGFADGSLEVDSSYFPFTTRYENCTAVDFQFYGYSGATTATGNPGRVELIRCNMRGDGLSANLPYYQVAYNIKASQTDVHDCIASQFNGAPIQIAGAAKININGFYADYSDGSGSSGLRVNATQAELNVIDYKVRAGTSVPTTMLRNFAGSSVWNIDGVRCVNRATPPPLYSVDSGTPTWNVQELLGAVRPSTTNGDASVTLTAHTSEPTQIWNTALSTNRTVTLSTTAAINGDTFRIVRTNNATGASNLTVSGKALAAGQWADVQYDGSAWQLVASGSL